MTRPQLSEKQKWQHEQLNLPLPAIPEAPDFDAITQEIYVAFMTIERSRRITESGGRLPLTLSDVNAYYSSRSVGIERTEFEEAIFTADDIVLGVDEVE